MSHHAATKEKPSLKTKQTVISFLKHLKEAVNRHGYSQKEIADYLELYYTMISRIVNDNKTGKNRCRKKQVSGLDT